MAVTPGMRYLGMALLEGEVLIRYGVKTFQGASQLADVRSEVKQFLGKHVCEYRPDVLAVEQPFYAQAVASKNLCALTEEIIQWGKWRGLTVQGYLPTAPKAFFCGGRRGWMGGPMGNTKESLAEAMVAQYPFLRRYLTYLPWRQRYWLNVFDAVALALMCQRKLAGPESHPEALQDQSSRWRYAATRQFTGAARTWRQDVGSGREP